MFFKTSNLVSVLYRKRIALFIAFSIFIFSLSWLQYSSVYYKNQQHNDHQVTNPIKIDVKTEKSKNLIEVIKNIDPVLWNPAFLEDKFKQYKLRIKQSIEEKTTEKPNVTEDMLNILNKLDRIVHIDLKGAPPKPEYFKKFIPLIKKYGATGILIEYEDMFPYTGRLEVVKHGNAYKENDVKLLLNLAKDHNLTVMPLVQTYGHLEWLLKHKDFAHLRENPEFPQVISPCMEESYDVIFDMLDQVIKLHHDVPYFHIGCDEVYYKLTNPKCNVNGTMFFEGEFIDAFMNHIMRVAEYIRKQIPAARIIVWNDMMNELMMHEKIVEKYKPLIDKNQVEPMIWAYVEDVISWYQPNYFKNYRNIFSKIWVSSAYKGASGELSTFTSIQHHYLNHISWAQLMYNQETIGACNFTGIAITGWSRYDHFLQLCELLPQAIPSLVFNLQAIQHGELSKLMRINISRQLGCRQMIPWTPEDAQNSYLQCSFPGHEVYEAILEMKIVFDELEKSLEFARKYMSPLSLKYNYAHKARAEESIEKLEASYREMNIFKNDFIKACEEIYWEDTINEWLEVYFMPEFDKLYEFIVSIKKVMKENHWSPRPLPVTLKDHPDRF